MLTQLTPVATMASAVSPDESQTGPSDFDQDFAELYRNYFPRIVAWVTARTGDRALGEDVAQEALLAARRYMGTYDPSRPFWPWIRRIAGHVLGRRLTDTVRERPLSDAGIGEAPAVEDIVERLCCRDEMQTALAAIPSRHRAALWLRYGEERSSVEAACAFGLTTNAFNQLLWRARKMLREEYERVGSAAKAMALTPFGLLARMLRGGVREKATAATNGSALSLLPLAAFPVLGLVVIGTVGAPALFKGRDDAAARNEQAPAHTRFVPATSSHVLPRRPEILRAADIGPAAPTRRPIAPPSAHVVGASRGPLTSGVRVAANPVETGQAEADRTEIKTPVGTASVGGFVTGESDRIVCDFVNCE